MTSQLNVDSITNKAGTGPVVLTGQVSAKLWANLNGTGTIALRDSFNVASIADNGTGNYTVTSTSSMSDTNYVCCATAGKNAGDLLNASNNEDSYARTTSTVRTEVNRSSSDTQYDASVVESIWMGDLA